MGPGHYAVFDIAMHDHVLRRLYTETALRRAIENDELLLYYQPIIAISSGRIAGFEALIRWQHPERGLLEPDEFIPTAEETGLCLALDSWVMHEACRQMSVWLHQFSTLPPLTVNINLSPRAFAGEDFIQRVRHVLQETSLAPTSLKLEITEETMMIHVDSTIATLVELREMGIQLCIDDFGTGYSSLRYLHRFPIHMLKIDKSFIWTLETSSESNAITQSIIMLSHTLGKEVVAEGVETVSQLNYLRELKCDYVQGYYFSRPVDPEHIEMLLAVEAGVAEKRVAHS
jgi:EAL domain-containing protein (putative c-di-GMP-specific phosphodiesterase class I)